MQTTVQNEKAIRLGSGILRVDGINIGALQNAKLSVKLETSQLKADNAILDPRRKVSEAKISCDSWEINLEKLAKFTGIGTINKVSAEALTIESEIIAEKDTRVRRGQVFSLKEKNGNGEAATIVQINNGNGADIKASFTPNVIDGKTFLTYTGGDASILEGGLKVKYTVTPTARATYTLKDIASLIRTSRVEFENTNAEGKKFIIEFPRAYNVGGIDLAFQSDEKLDEVMKLPLEFQALATPDKDLLYIHDEQAV